MNSRIVTAFAVALQFVATHDGTAQATAKAPTSAVGKAIVAQEHAILSAIEKKDTVAFNKALGSDFVYVDQNGAVDWMPSMTSSIFKDCGLGTHWTIDHPMTKEVGSDVVVLTYSSAGKSTCNGQPAPSPVNSMSVWQKRGGRWVAVAHSETPAAPSMGKK